MAPDHGNSPSFLYIIVRFSSPLILAIAEQTEKICKGMGPKFSYFILEAIDVNHFWRGISHPKNDSIQVPVYKYKNRGSVALTCFDIRVAILVAVNRVVTTLRRPARDVLDSLSKKSEI